MEIVATSMSMRQVLATCLSAGALLSKPSSLRLVLRHMSNSILDQLVHQASLIEATIDNIHDYDFFGCDQSSGDLLLPARFVSAEEFVKKWIFGSPPTLDPRFHDIDHFLSAQEPNLPLNARTAHVIRPPTDSTLQKLLEHAGTAQSICLPERKQGHLPDSIRLPLGLLDVWSALSQARKAQCYWMQAVRWLEDRLDEFRRAEEDQQDLHAACRALRIFSWRGHVNGIRTSLPRISLTAFLGNYPLEECQLAAYLELIRMSTWGPDELSTTFIPDPSFSRALLGQYPGLHSNLTTEIKPSSRWLSKVAREIKAGSITRVVTMCVVDNEHWAPWALHLETKDFLFGDFIGSKGKSKMLNSMLFAVNHWLCCDVDPALTITHKELPIARQTDKSISGILSLNSILSYLKPSTEKLVDGSPISIARLRARIFSDFASHEWRQVSHSILNVSRN
jgi:hypothetical protein